MISTPPKILYKILQLVNDKPTKQPKIVQKKVKKKKKKNAQLALSTPIFEHTNLPR